jgi:imidazolonepropionase-like amidohydrolase
LESGSGRLGQIIWTLQQAYLDWHVGCRVGGESVLPPTDKIACPIGQAVFIILKKRGNMPTTPYKVGILVFCVFLFALLVACSSQTQSVEIVIHNGQLFEATGDGPISNGAIVITDGYISAVGSESDVIFPEGATLIDAEGGTIMPGLIDARASTLINRLEISENQIDEISLTLYLTKPLQAGITTIRAIGWDYATQPDLTVLRNVLADYGNNVPTLVFVGMITHAEGNVFEIYPEDSIGVINLEEMQEAAEDLIQAGADQLGFLQPIPPDIRANRNQLIGLSKEQQTAFAELIHEKGLRVIAQTAYPEDALAAVVAGVDELVNWPHGSDEPLPDELIQALVDNSVSVLTGFSVGVIRPYEGDVRRFIDSGGVIVFGTFAPNSTSLHRPVNEMRQMTYFDMTPYEILMSATANAAKAVGLGDLVGTLEVGKQADIIIVQGNPLDNIEDIEDIMTVIKAGEVVFQLDLAD